MASAGRRDMSIELHRSDINRRHRQEARLRCGRAYRRQPRRSVRRRSWIASRGSTACARRGRSEEHTSELQSLMRISYAVFCLKKKKPKQLRHMTATKTYLNTNNRID